MFAILDKAKCDVENIRGLNLAAVRHTTVQVIRLLLWRKLLEIGHNLLYLACTDRGPVNIVYIFIVMYNMQNCICLLHYDK
jgi:hypothetical protein